MMTAVFLWMLASILLTSPYLCEGRTQSHHQFRTVASSEPTVPVVAKKIRPDFLPSALAKLSNECQCRFQGVCTCEGSMEFMDCISDACSSGKCDCHQQQYHKACIDIAGTCPSLDFECTSERAVCTVEVRTVDGKEVQKETAAQILDDLSAMKEKKCRLEKANEDGWLNADRRLEELRPYIEERLDALQRTNTTAPWMGCGVEPGLRHTPPRKIVEEKSACAMVAGNLFALLLSLVAASGI